MNRLSLVACLSCLLVAASPARAVETLAKGPDWSVGGAVSAVTSRDRVTLWDAGAFSAGMAASNSAAVVSSHPTSGLQTGGLQAGGFLAWRGDDYRLDATLAPSLDGTVAAGLGAVTGARPGQLGTSYGLRLGADWSAERYGSSPISPFGEIVPSANDVNVSFTISHALTSNFSLIGEAEAHRTVGPVPEGGASPAKLLIGAGFGYRF